MILAPILTIGCGVLFASSSLVVLFAVRLLWRLVCR